MCVNGWMRCHCKALQDDGVITICASDLPLGSHHYVVTSSLFDSSWLSPCSAGRKQPVKTSVGGGWVVVGGRVQVFTPYTGFWLSQTFAHLRDTRAASSPCAPPQGDGNLHATGLRARDGVGVEISVEWAAADAGRNHRQAARLLVGRRFSQTRRPLLHTPRVVFLLAYCSYALIPK